MGGACTSSLSSISSTFRLSHDIITVDATVEDPSKKLSFMLRIRGWFRLKITSTIGPTGHAGLDPAMLWSAPKVTLPFSPIQQKISSQPSPKPPFLLDSGSFVFQFYSGGILNSQGCGTDIDHSMVAIGYGVDSVKGDYYIIGDSWGKSWGLQGYANILIVYGPGICRVQVDLNLPLF